MKIKAGEGLPPILNRPYQVPSPTDATNFAILGMTWHDEHCAFSIWLPLASNLSLGKGQMVTRVQAHPYAG